MTKIMGRLDTGFDKRGNRWDLSEEDHQWCWRKFKEGKFIKESDKTFDTKEDCEADAKAHGMEETFTASRPALVLLLKPYGAGL